MSKEWDELYQAAVEHINPTELSPQMSIGCVAAAVLSKDNHVYTGVCIDTSCSLGMCAERNALSTMLSYGEFEVNKVVAVDQDGTVMPPCGACREFMMQLCKSAKDIEILLHKNGKSVLLGDLLPFQPY